MAKKKNTGIPTIKQLPSGSWHAKVYTHTDENGKRHYKSFTNLDKKKLVLELAQFKADKKEARIEAASGRIDLTLREAMTEYIESKNAVSSPTTVKGYRDIRDNHLKDIMEIRITDITQQLIQVSINREAARYSPKTVRNAYALFTATMSFFLPDIAFHTTLPQKEKSEVVIPTEEEITVLVEAAKEKPIYLPLLLGSCCGLRRSEIAALTWEDLDLKEGTIRIHRALVVDDTGHFVEKGTKTSAGTRTVRLFPLVLDELKRLKEETGTASPDTRITISPNQITRHFSRLLDSTGVRHYRFHDLRHYCVSVMLSLNIPKFYIANYVGHESEHMIDTVYGHIMASRKTAVEDLMQDYYSKIFR